MGKKKSYQNVKVPRPLNAVERKLYGWVEEAIFTQPSVVLGDSLPELRRTMRLTEVAAAEGDFVLEAARPSDWLQFRADEDGSHFLWVYQELFICLGGPFAFYGLPKGGDDAVPGGGVCKLFGIFEESIQKFKWHYFKVLPAPGRRPFWLDDEGKPFPWVYWNREVKDFVIHELDPLETAVFEFFVSLPADDLLLVEMKKTKLDRMMEMMADPTRMAPRSVLPTGVPSATAAAAAAASAAPVGSSVNPATPSVQVPRPPPATSKAKKSSSKRERPEGVDVEVEEAAKEDLDADLKQKRRRKEKGKEEDIVDHVLGDDAAWEHAGMLSDQLLGDSWRLQCQALACQQLGLEAALKAKTKAEEELLAVKDQLSVLKVERDSALEYLPLKEKADSLAQQLSQKEVEHKSLDEDIKVLKAQLESAQLSVSKDQKRAEAAEGSVKSLTMSLETAQAELRKSREEADYWCTEWKSLGTEAQEMCQETLEIVLDQVSHLCHGVDFSAITVKTRWDPKGKRIHVPEELLGNGAGVAETLPEVVLKQQEEQENASARVSRECPT
ncbi:hypothetical protein PIB30_024793 [Stylosanthes scabra]|uniref:Uncharacterized protein n=1 Tax=Stylosanthes scabra TaxID=79078 RepID=A0ABU6V914_9FABA|nr:hypothetical protein [Stylosanthes scabra]